MSRVLTFCLLVRMIYVISTLEQELNNHRGLTDM